MLFLLFSSIFIGFKTYKDKDVCRVVRVMILLQHTTISNTACLSHVYEIPLTETKAPHVM